MNLTNQYQYPWQVMELLKPVTLPLPSTGEQLSVAAEGEARRGKNWEGHTEGKYVKANGKANA